MLRLPLVLFLSGGLIAASAVEARPVCDIEIQGRFGLYVVTVGGEPFRNKGYLTHDDAANLRNVLIHSGTCLRAARVRTCTIEPTDDGEFAILREGIRIAARSILPTVESATRKARQLEAAELCDLDTSVPVGGPMVAASAPATAGGEASNSGGAGVAGASPERGPRPGN